MTHNFFFSPTEGAVTKAKKPLEEKTNKVQRQRRQRKPKPPTPLPKTSTPKTAPTSAPAAAAMPAEPTVVSAGDLFPGQICHHMDRLLFNLRLLACPPYGYVANCMP